MFIFSAGRRPEAAQRRAFRSLLSLLLPVLACGRADEIPPGQRVDGSVVTDISRPVAQGNVVLVRITAGPDRYVFEPAEVRIRAGDVVRFVLTRPLPESIAFDTAGVAPDVATYVADRGLLRGTLLTRAGQAYDASFADAPPGRYPYVSLPHASLGMRGVVVVEPAD